MDLLGAVLEFVLKPRGRALPAGEHLTVDPAFSAFGWPEKPVIFKLETYSDDDEPLGAFVATADTSTRCTIDGHATSLEQILESIGEEHDRARVVALRPGVLAAFDLITTETRD